MVDGLKKQSMLRLDGHKKGVDAVEKLLDFVERLE